MVFAFPINRLGVTPRGSRLNRLYSGNSPVTQTATCGSYRVLQTCSILKYSTTVARLCIHGRVAMSPRRPGESCESLMNWPRILGVCFVVGLAGIAIGMPVAGAEPNVQIEATAVDAEYLTTEDAITIDVTVSNLESSTDPVDISSLYIRGEGTAKTYDRLGDVSTIDPGGSVTVPLSVTFDDPGEHRLTVHMVASSDGGGSESYEYPLLVDVEASDVTAELTVTGADDLGQTNVTLTNFGNREISRAEIVARVNDTVVDRLFDT